MTRHIIKLDGETVLGAKASAALLRDLLGVLVDATHITPRTRGSSLGADPEWLDIAANVDVL